MANRKKSRNGLFSFLTEKREVYRRDVAGERKDRAQAAKFAAGEAKKKAAAEKRRAAEMAEMQADIQANFAYNTGARHKREGKKPHPEQAVLASAQKYLGAAKGQALARREYSKGYKQNPGMCGKNPGPVVAQGVPKLIEVGGGRKKKVWTWQGHGWPKEDYAGFVWLGSEHYGDRKSGKVFAKEVKNPSEAFSGRTPQKAGYLSGVVIGARDRQDNRTTLEGERGRLVGILRDHWAIPRRQLEEYSRGLNEGYRVGYNKKTKAGKSNAGRGKKKAAGRSNPGGAASAAELYEKFHGHKPEKVTRLVEYTDVPRNLAELGDLVRLVIDNAAGGVSVIDFNLSDPRKIVKLAASPMKDKAGEVKGLQLYLRGGDQEINLKGLGMGGPLWVRDHMELGRLHHFPRGERLISGAGGKLRIAQPGERAKAGEQEIRGSITYQTRKGMDENELIDYWHKAGEESERQYGAASRPIVAYDYRSKKLSFVGGQYHIDAPGIIN
jgi:hypothetical protein